MVVPVVLTLLDVFAAVLTLLDVSLPSVRMVVGTATAEATGGTAGVSSQWTFGTALIWGGVVVLVLYVLYRRFGYRPP